MNASLKYVVRHEQTGRAVQFNSSKSGFDFVNDDDATLFDSSAEASKKAQGSTLHRWGSYEIVPFQSQKTFL